MVWVNDTVAKVRDFKILFIVHLITEIYEVIVSVYRGMEDETNRVVKVEIVLFFAKHMVEIIQDVLYD